MNTAITDVPYGQAALGILPVLMVDLRHTLGVAACVCAGVRRNKTNSLKLQTVDKALTDA